MTHIKDTARDVNSLEMPTPTSVIQLAHKCDTTRPQTCYNFFNFLKSMKFYNEHK